jgi:N-formylglutamate amidohydrolase
MPHFTLTRPECAETPVLVEVPHAGLAVPEPVCEEIHAPLQTVLRDADIFVDQLYEGAPATGATLLTAGVSRYVVDLNRGPNDVDSLTVKGHPAPQAHRPRGVIWRTSTLGQPVFTSPLSMAEYEARLNTYYRPYHETLTAELERIKKSFGYVILVAAHSMPSVGRTIRGERLSRRADIVPGTLGRTSADVRVIDFVDQHFRDAGFSVSHDDPYRGGWTTRHYGRVDEGVHAIQIELNRDLYVDEDTRKPRSAAWPPLQQVLIRMLEGLGNLRLG